MGLWRDVNVVCNRLSGEVSIPYSRVKVPKQIDLLLDILTPEDGTDTLCLKFANNPTLRSNPRESLQRSRSLKFRVFCSFVVVTVMMMTTTLLSSSAPSSSL